MGNPRIDMPGRAALRSRPWAIIVLCCALGLAALPAAGEVNSAIAAVVPAPDAARAQIDAQLAAAHLVEPLVATGLTTQAEDEALVRAVSAYEHRASPDDLTSLTGFLAAYPRSGWRVAVLTNLGLVYLHYGYFSRALDAWEQAWRDGKEATGRRARALVDRAVGELVRLQAELGPQERLVALLDEIGDRPVSGSATEMVQFARQTLWVMRTDPKHLYLCGPTALKMLMLALHATPEQVGFLSKVRAGPQGTSLAEVAQLAAQAKVALEPVFRKPGEPVPIPSIVHWKIGHFAAIVGEANGRYHVEDSTFGRQGLWVTQAALDAEASGYFLASSSEARAAKWREVGADEAGRVRGAGPHNQNGGNPKCPMCVYSINEQEASLHLTDTPVGYAPPKGPSAEVMLGYAQQDQNQPANFNFFNVSQKWTLNWLSYVEDDPTSPGTNVTRYQRDGALYSYTGYDSSTHDFSRQEDDASVLVLEKTSPVVYERFLSDGTVETYAESDDSAVFPRNVFLTRIIDPQGNALSLTYGKVSGQVRLLSLTDATRRKTTFTYGSSISPLLITKITDPFGRSAELTYDGHGRLSSITDVIGLTSKFAYDASSLVDALTTPYGTTHFAYGGTGIRLFLNIVDPLGYGEREEAFEPAPVPFSEPYAPQGMPVPLFDQYLNYRNSFHWDKHQYAVGHCTPRGGCEYADARITHFDHDASDTNIEWDTVESSKEPLENRVWNNYPGQPTSGLGAAASGTYDMPSAIGRVLDNGQTQLKQFAYNAAGNPIELVDPVGRKTLLTYAANQIDVDSIAQTTASGNLTIATFTYNSRHRPLTYTDPAGKTTTYTYNSAGQLRSETNALGQQTTYNYDSTGDLASVVNANGKTAASFTYDGFDRIATYTDSDGWTVDYAYDAADRLTQAAYLDGTTDQYTYSKLDLISMKDRQGHVWSYVYDADRRLTSVTDPLLNKTTYTYYENGALKSLTDPNGHTTNWNIDVESRPTAKIYADGTETTYNYEITTSRLNSVTDALGQAKSYQYALDDRLAGINYQDALNPTPNVGFAYDPYFPRIVTMTSGTGTTQYSYVPVGALGALRLKQESGPLPSGAITYGYDALGRVVTRTVAGAPVESLQYDAIGRLIGHTDALGKFAFGYLGQTGQLTSRKVVGASVTTAWSYLSNTGNRRLAGIANAFGRQYQYATTPEDLITQIKENKSGSLLQSWNINYDNEYRLLSADSSSGTNYGYTLDPADNIIKSGTTALTYNKVNELTSVGTQPYVYDADGDLVSDGARTYAWDAENRLVGITYTAQRGQKTSFVYDGLDRRVAITETPVSGAATTTDYIWCGSRICQSRNGARVVNRLYYVEGEDIPASKALFYYGPDQLGSVRDVYAASPLFSMMQAYDYDPYGNPTVTPETGPLTDFRYAGMLYHAGSGLYLTQYRAYDPHIGRWLSRDPSGEESGPNSYAYVGDNPVNAVDPNGRIGVYVGLGGNWFAGAADAGSFGGGAGGGVVITIGPTGPPSISRYTYTNPVSQAIGMGAGGGLNFGITSADNPCDFASISKQSSAGFPAGLGPVPIWVPGEVGWGGNGGAWSLGSGISLGTGLGAQSGPSNTTIYDYMPPEPTPNGAWEGGLPQGEYGDWGH